MAKVRGEVIFVGIREEPLPLDLQNVSFKEQHFVGTRVYSFRDSEITLNLLAQGEILLPSHAANKGRIASLTKALSNEWAWYGIVIAIASGYMRTAITAPIKNRTVS